MASDPTAIETNLPTAERVDRIRQALDRSNQLREKMSDWVNPILVKEARQALKSRQFVVTFFLLLLVSWVISSFGVIFAGEQLEFGAIGGYFFSCYYMVLSVAIFLIVPLGAYRSLLAERDENTYELLSITTLSPRQIVWGKLSSAFLQLLIYYSSISPFIAFCALLQGFDLPIAAFVLVMSMIVSMGASLIAITFASFSKRKHWQMFSMLVLLAGLCWLVFGSWGLIGMTSFQSLPFDDADFWLVIGLLLVGFCSYFVLLLQLATAQLTFETDNRSTPIRITCSVQFWLLWSIGCFGVLVFYIFVRGYSSIFSSSVSLNILDEIATVCLVLSGIHWSVVGLFAATEDDHLSRRARRSLPSNGMVRLLSVPFIPGGQRGYLYLLLHLAALMFIVTGLQILIPSARSSEDLVALAYTICCYIAIFCGLGALVMRLGSRVSNEIKSAHARVFTLILLGAGTILPLVPSVFDRTPWDRDSIFYVTNPFYVLSRVERDWGNQAITLVLLGVTTIAVVMLNFSAMMRGIRDVMTLPWKQAALQLNKPRVAQGDVESASTAADQTPSGGTTHA